MTGDTVRQMTSRRDSSDSPVNEERTNTFDRRGSDASLLDMEREAREKACTNSIYLVISNFFATVFVFIIHLVSVEMIVSFGLTVGLTIYLFDLKQNDPDIDFEGLSMDRTLLTFAVISPITLTIGMAFRRREDALQCVADFRSLLLPLYSAHAIWDWSQKPGDTENSGRTQSSVDWIAHSDQTCRVILAINRNLSHFLTLPSYSRARHKVTPIGVREATRTRAIGARLYDNVIVHIGRLEELCEILKREGLPATEASRVRQYERLTLFNSEKLRNIKDYRTPQALRCFNRIFSVVLPPFYSPFFADMGIALNSLTIAIIFASLTSIALTGLFETVSQFEDPFLESSGLDGVHVVEDLVDRFTPQILSLRKLYFPEAPGFKEDGRVVGTAGTVGDDFSTPTVRKSFASEHSRRWSQIRLINNQ